MRHLGLGAAAFAVSLVLMFATPRVAMAAAPSNDDIADATVITSLPFSDGPIDTTDATDDGPGDCFGNAHSVFYTFTPATDMFIGATSDGNYGGDSTSYDTAIGVFTGSPDSPSLVACNQAVPSEPYVHVVAGTTYYFEVAGRGSEWNPSTSGTLHFDVFASTNLGLQVASTSLDPNTGWATVQGRLTCNEDTSGTLSGTLSQSPKSGALHSTPFACTTPGVPWTLTLPDVKFKPGGATLSVQADDAFVNDHVSTGPLSVSLSKAAEAAPSSCGPAWRRSPEPAGGAITSLSAVDRQDVWAVSGGVVEHFDGASWSVSSALGGMSAVGAISANDVWTAGVGQTGQYQDNYRTQTVFQHWNGRFWSVVPSPSILSGIANIRLRSVGGAASDDVWVTGTSFDYGGGEATLTFHWDGNAWSLQNLGFDSGDLWSVDARTVDDVWAVGADYDVPSSVGSTTVIWHHDANGWTEVTPSDWSDPSAIQGELFGVAALSPSDVWAVGDTGSNGESGGTSGAEMLIMHYDGTSWTRVPTPDPRAASTLHSVAAASPSDVWAFGDVAGSTGTDTPMRLHWDGSTWSVAPGDWAVPSPGGLSAATAGGRWWSGGATMATMCPQTVADGGIEPATAYISLNPPQRVTVTWSFPATNTSSHEVKYASSLGLFDSGLRAPGGSFTTSLFAASTYPVIDPTTGSRASLRVPVRVTPASGSTATSFKIVWASETAPTGYAYDVRVRAPGSTTFVLWRSGTTASQAAFTPNAGAGAYVFEARLRQPGSGHAAGWSPTTTVHVSP